MPKAQKTERPDPADGRPKRARASAVAKWMGKISKNFDPEPRYLIPILQFIQNDAGYLQPGAMQAAAAFLKIPESKVFGVASFYAQFHFEPRGRNTITICRGTACHVRGSGPLLRELEKHLGVEAGGTTEDLVFTLETVACYGSCALAPVVVVNKQVHRQQTAATLKALVAQTGAAKPLRKKTTRAKKKTTRRRKTARKRRG